MTAHYTFSGPITETEKKSLKKYGDEKFTRFETYLSSFNKDLKTLDVKVDRFIKNNAYRIELILHLPQTTLIAHETKHNINETIDLVIEKLERQIAKLKDRMKNHS